MPTRRLVIWNVENFGSFTHLKKGPDGDCILGTLYAIAQVVLSCNADIFVMQECRRRGRDYLEDLAGYLGDDWSYDYLPGSIRDGVGAIAGFNSLNYISDGNSEGYAVLWRGDDTLSPFAGDGVVKMSRGRDGDPDNDGYINLVSRGSDPEIIWDAPIPAIADDEGYNEQARFPRPSCRAFVNDTDDPVRQERNQRVFQWTLVRHPALIHVTDGDGHVPVVVYHAPNGTNAPFYAGLAAALSAPMGEEIGDPVVFGGDMNLTTQNAFQNTHWNFFFNLHLQNGTAAPGADNDIREFGYRRTQVQYVYPAYSAHDGLIVNGRNYEHPRDILYSRHLTNVQARVVDVLDQLQDEDSDLAQWMFYFPEEDDFNPIADSVAAASAAGAPARYRLPHVVRTNAALVGQLQAPFAEDADPRQLANRLAAATFYRLFISDHLPLYIQFDVDDEAGGGD